MASEDYDKAKQIVKDYTLGKVSGEDNKLRAACALLESETFTLIEKAIRDGIDSNELLAKSNQVYSDRMRTLTFALVLIGAIQIIVSVTGLFLK